MSNWRENCLRLRCWWEQRIVGSERLFDLRHPPLEFYWCPDWSFHFTRRNPLFWLFLLFGRDR